MKHQATNHPIVVVRHQGPWTTYQLSELGLRIDLKSKPYYAQNAAKSKSLPRGSFETEYYADSSYALTLYRLRVPGTMFTMKQLSELCERMISNAPGVTAARPSALMGHREGLDSCIIDVPFTYQGKQRFTKALQIRTDHSYLEIRISFPDTSKKNKAEWEHIFQSISWHPFSQREHLERLEQLK